MIKIFSIVNKLEKVRTFELVWERKQQLLTKVDFEAEAIEILSYPIA